MEHITLNLTIGFSFESLQVSFTAAKEIKGYEIMKSLMTKQDMVKVRAPPTHNLIDLFLQDFHILFSKQW